MSPGLLRIPATHVPCVIPHLCRSGFHHAVERDTPDVQRFVKEHALVTTVAHSCRERLGIWVVRTQRIWRVVIYEDPSDQIEIVNMGLICLLCRKAGTTVWIHSNPDRRTILRRKPIDESP